MREPRTDTERRQTIELGRFYIWEDRRPVSMACSVDTPPGGSRIGAVYTPPDLRRRGYAGAVVAALSRALFDEGCEWCCLYTDMDNPTSNSIYPKIGYRPVLDSVKAEFAPPRAT